MKKGFIAVFLAFICTFLFYGIRYINSPLKTQKAVFGTYDDSVYTDCYFVRDEVVYSSSTDGTVYNHYSDGSRVQKGGLVSTIYTGDVSDDIFKELNTIDKKIENYKSLSMYVSSALEEETNLENKVDEYKDELIGAAVDGNIRLVTRYKDAINNLRAGGEGKSVSDTITELEQKKAEIEKKIGNRKQDIISENSGVFTTVLDGMEHILTPENVKKYTPADFDSIKRTTGRTANDTVKAGDSICKIVNNHECFILCSIATERLVNYKVGSSVEMRFDDIPGDNVKGNIEYISEEENGKCVLLISTSQYMESAYSIRYTPMELIFKSYSGYKVPANAVRTEDGVRGVLARKGNYERFYPCEILYTNENGEYVIINSPQDAERKLDGIDEIVLGER